MSSSHFEDVRPDVKARGREIIDTLASLCVKDGRAMRVISVSAGLSEGTLAPILASTEPHATMLAVLAVLDTLGYTLEIVKKEDA